MKIDPRVPDFLKGNIPLQRRYIAELNRAGCGGCDSGELDRRFFREARSKTGSLAPRRRKR